MFCINCGQKATDQTKFCINCGEALDANEDPTPTPPLHSTLNGAKGFFQKINASALIKVIIGIVIIGFIVYANIDNNSVKTNNDALDSLNSGNSVDAISQLQSASQSALSDENKLNTLKNLAYAYSGEGQNDQALASFKEALPHAKIDSFDYYLVLGEVAYLEGKPSVAKQYYEKAYAMNQSDFQINNALALFYLDAEELYPQYADVVKGLAFARTAYNANMTPITMSNLGVALVLNEKYQDALTYLVQINLQQHPYINLWLGLAYAATENVPKAKYHFQQYVNTGGETPPEITEYLRNN